MDCIEAIVTSENKCKGDFCDKPAWRSTAWELPTILGSGCMGGHHGKHPFDKPQSRCPLPTPAKVAAKEDHLPSQHRSIDPIFISDEKCAERPLPNHCADVQPPDTDQVRKFGQDLMEEVLALDSSGAEVAIDRIQSLLQDIDSARAGLAFTRRVLEKKLRVANEKVQSTGNSLEDKKHTACRTLCVLAHPGHHGEPSKSGEHTSPPSVNICEAGLWEAAVDARSFKVHIDTASITTHEIPSRTCKAYKIEQARLASELSKFGSCTTDEESSSEEEGEEDGRESIQTQGAEASSDEEYTAGKQWPKEDMHERIQMHMAHDPAMLNTFEHYVMPPAA